MPEQPSSSSQGRSTTPARDLQRHNDEDSGGQAEAGNGFWKRRFHELKDAVNAENQSKRKRSGGTTPVCQLGRGIRKVIFLCGDIGELVSNSDKYLTYKDEPDGVDLEEEFEGLDDDEIEEIKLNWKRCHTAVKELDKLVHGFEKKIDNASPEELNQFYTELQRGADSAHGDDLGRIRALLADWLNKGQPPASPLLIANSRAERGIAHDVTGRLLCPVDLDWDNLVVRAKIRAADEEYDWLSSFHVRCFYAQHEGNPENLEQGYLKSTLLVKVYKAIFTSPSSAEKFSEEADNAENIRPAKLSKSHTNDKAQRRNVASKVLPNNQVTPRSIAYAAVQLHFNLQDAESWTPIYGGFDYQGLYNYIVDFFEDVPGPAAKKRAKDLLHWWSQRIFPVAGLRRQSNISNSRQEFKKQRAALERGAVN